MSVCWNYYFCRFSFYCLVCLYLHFSVCRVFLFSLSFCQANGKYPISFVCTYLRHEGRGMSDGLLFVLSIGLAICFLCILNDKLFYYLGPSVPVEFTEFSIIITTIAHV
jgi:hypothetical protein